MQPGAVRNARKSKLVLARGAKKLRVSVMSAY